MNPSYKRLLGVFSLGAGVLLITYFIGLQYFGYWHDEWSGYSASDSTDVASNGGNCNIAVVPVAGEIVSVGSNEYSDTQIVNSDDVLAALKSAQNNSDIKGVLVQIDSYGGSPVASEMIANALKRLSLPVVSLIREAGASGGYLVASGGTTIIASPFSDVGSIGVTRSYLDETGEDAKQGLKFEQLSSAKFKDYGNPSKALTDDERALIKRDLDIFHQQFVKEVATNRGISVDAVGVLADGSSMPASLALENKLIDAIGDQETARSWFADKLQLNKDKVIFCD